MLIFPIQAAEAFYAKNLNAIFVFGIIEPGDFAKIEHEMLASGYRAERIFLTSIGGSFYESLKIGNWISSRKLDTIAGRVCASACAYVWLAGEEKYALLDWPVTIHAPFFQLPSGKILVAIEGTLEYTWYLSKLGYPKDLVDAIYAVSLTSTNDVFPITGYNTERFGLVDTMGYDETKWQGYLRTFRGIINNSDNFKNFEKR